MSAGAFTDIFSGSPVTPTITSYVSYTLTSSIALLWPTEISSGNLVASTIDVTASSGGLAISLPDATQAANGKSILLRNLGAVAINLRGYTGTVLTALQPGFSYYVYLQSNATTAGTWGVLLFGGSSAPFTPAAAAGPGLTSYSSTQLATAMPIVAQNAGFSIGLTNRASLNVYTGGAGTMALLAAATAGNNFFVAAFNNGTGALVIDPSGAELINGAATLTLNVGESAIISCDGTGWYTASLSRTITSTITFVQIDIAGGAGTTNLTSSQTANTIIFFTGALTGNRVLTVPAAAARWFMRNGTTGAYTVNIQVVGGIDPGILLAQAQQQAVITDGNNTYNGVQTAPIAPTSYAAGLVGTPSIYLTATSTTGLYFPTTTSMAFAAGGAEVFRMAASGLLVNSASLTDSSNNVPWARLSNATLAQIQAYSFGM